MAGLRLFGGARRRARLTWLIVAALAGGMFAAPNSSATPGGPGVAPPLPPITQYGSAPARLSDRPLAMAPAKARAWQERRRLAASGRTLSATTHRILSVPLYQQKNGYYCGPATLAMVTKYLGVGWSGSSGSQQDAAAQLLRTTTDGTAWCGADNVPTFPKSSWYPMEDALNYRLYRAKKSSWYDHVSLPASPTAAQQITFRDHLTFDIDHGYPGADNQASDVGFQIGSQPYGAWQHWWVARGYDKNGETTYFNDPAAWSHGQVSREKTRGTAGSVVPALGSRGYIW
jgi:hypothetical protein